ncbi:MAG TPA: DEAD/DEAH box helicase, partial [Stellaceae bacterium]
MPDDHASSREPSPIGVGEQEVAARRVRVLLPLPIPEALDYLAPEGASPEPGSFVHVPLGQRSLAGVVWDGVGDELPEDRLKPIIETLPTPRLQPELRRFVERVAAYTMAPPGSVLRMTMSVPDALRTPRPRRLCAASPTGLAETRLTPARRRVIEVLCTGPPMPAAELARLAACGTGVVRDLIAAGFVEERFAPPEAPESRSPDWRLCGSALSPDQAIAAHRLVDSVDASGFRVTLLDGVTGSGKTETYFAALAAALAAGRQVLVLLPEIALGAQWLERFRERFGALPQQWHSDMTGAERRDIWRAVAAGRARVVVGARSALFLPFPELGLI